MPSPRADYVCQPCLDSGAMEEPLELPVMSKACPLCGGATLERVWSGARSNPGIARGTALTSDGHSNDRTIADTISESNRSREVAARANAENRGLGLPGSFAVPIERAAALVGAPMGNANPRPITSPLLAGTVAGREAHPGPGTLVDKDSKG